MPRQKQEENHDRSAERDADSSLFVGGRYAAIGALLAIGVALGGHFLIGRVYSGGEAAQLIGAVIPSARSLASSVITATGSILSLMLTLLGLTNEANSKFDSHFYKRIQQIGLLSTISLATAILLLLALSLPLQQADNVPSDYYRLIYYLLIAISSILSGLLVAVVLMLYNALQSILKVVSPLSLDDERSPLREEAAQQGGRK